MRLIKTIIITTFILIQLLFAADVYAHRSNTPRGVHTVIAWLYGIKHSKVHSKVAHNYNNFKNIPPQLKGKCGYRGGHSGYDIKHENDRAKFYSLTDGVVIHKLMPKNPKVNLSYLAIHNVRDNKVIFYVHLSYIRVNVGDRVYVGKYLGRQGWNSKYSSNYHIHLEVRTVLNRKKPPIKPSCGAALVYNNPNIEPIGYLYNEIREHLLNRRVIAASPIQPRILTETWGNLKSRNLPNLKD